MIIDLGIGKSLLGVNGKFVMGRREQVPERVTKLLQSFRSQYSEGFSAFVRTGSYRFLRKHLFLACLPSLNLGQSTYCFLVPRFVSIKGKFLQTSIS